MADWAWWLVMAGVLVTVEIFTGTFYLLMLALGLVAGGMVALAGLGTASQFIAASAVGSLATLLLRKSRFGAKNRRNPAHDPNVNLDIGKTLVVDAWQPVPGGVNRSRVSYRGAMWDVELENGEEAKPGLFVIQEIRGNRLIVRNVSESSG